MWYHGLKKWPLKASCKEGQALSRHFKINGSGIAIRNTRHLRIAEVQDRQTGQQPCGSSLASVCTYTIGSMHTAKLFNLVGGCTFMQ